MSDTPDSIDTSPAVGFAVRPRLVDVSVNTDVIYGDTCLATIMVTSPTNTGALYTGMHDIKAQLCGVLQSVYDMAFAAGASSVSKAKK